MFKLLGPDSGAYESDKPGALGGYRKLRIYGSLDCKSAKRAIAKGHYVKHRVFFADEPTAIAAGYRPCQKCLPKRYAKWKSDPGAWPQNASQMGWITHG